MENKDDTIDLTSEIKRKGIGGERGAFKYGLKRKMLPSGGKLLLLTILSCALAIASALLWKTWKIHNKEAEPKTVSGIVRNILPPLKIIAPPLPPAAQPQESLDLPTAEKSTSTTATTLQPIPMNPVAQRRLLPSLKGANETGTNNEAVQLQAREGIQQSASNESELQTKLKPLSLEASAAGIIADADYLLTQGTMIDCQLETRLVTTQAGMATCYTTRNTYSTNGRVVLIDRGSKIVGHYQGGMQQGQARIFVLWSRIETPQGVVVNLDSPSSGPLGESGLGGVVDEHFFQRFGGAVMMSLIGDLGQYAANKASKNTGTSVQFSNTPQGMQQAAVEALKNSINIPPTLYKNHGERISIFVARDLDFKGVYELEAK